MEHSYNQVGLQPHSPTLSAAYGTHKAVVVMNELAVLIFTNIKPTVAQCTPRWIGMIMRSWEKTSICKVKIHAVDR